MCIPSSSTLSTRFLTPLNVFSISLVALTPSGRIIVTLLALLVKLIYTSFSNTASPKSITVFEPIALTSQPVNSSSSISTIFLSKIELYFLTSAKSDRSHVVP